MRWTIRGLIAVGGGLMPAPAVLAQTSVPVVAPYEIVGDAIPVPLAGRTGDAARGRKLAFDREVGNCLICHQVKIATELFQGNVGPSLNGVGSRLSVGQIRYRLVDQSRLNPATLMPPYHRVDGLTRVAARYRGRPVFSAQDIEDVVTWLTTLTE